jgi:hypothetical protein
MSDSWIGSWFNLGTLLVETALVVVLVPELLRYRAEMRKTEERIGLNIETFDPRKNTQRVFGLDHITDDIRDLIDRAKNQAAYAGIDVGNEILIVGPEQSGKKALAAHIAKLADIGRAIVVHNPRDADVLGRAKRMIENRPSFWKRAARRATFRQSRPNTEKTLLLLPGLDSANDNKGEAWCDLLEALIEISSSLPHVLVVGTVKRYKRDGEVASWFGTVLPLPNKDSRNWNIMVREVAEGFLQEAIRENYRLTGMEAEAFITRILDVKPNPAEVKDIFAQCKTLATFEQRDGKEAGLLLTPEKLDVAIERVLPKAYRSIPRKRRARRPAARRAGTGVSRPARPPERFFLEIPRA